MPTTPFQLHGDAAKLQALASDQQTYRARFDAILSDFISHVTTVQGQWEGAGREGFDPFNIKSQEEYTNTQAAFGRLATGTETAGQNWQRATSTISGVWGGGGGAAAS